MTLKGSLARLLIDATHIKARKGGPCVGPSPVDRGKNGSKLTVLADEESVPLCVIFSAGNVSDTIQLPTILETARKQYGNLSQFRELLADKGYDSAANRAACRRHGLLPLILKRRPRRNLPVAAARCKIFTFSPGCRRLFLRVHMADARAIRASARDV